MFGPFYNKPQVIRNQKQYLLSTDLYFILLVSYFVKNNPEYIYIYIKFLFTPEMTLFPKYEVNKIQVCVWIL